jgi:hypothetical protein
MSAFEGKADIDLTSRYVRFWHKADIATSLGDVCFWGVKRTFTLAVMHNTVFPSRV